MLRGERGVACPQEIQRRYMITLMAKDNPSEDTRSVDRVVHG